MSDETILTSAPNNNSDSDEDLQILQEHLAPKYTVERKLGSGGMADVYLGFHNQLRRRIAIKVLPRAMSRDQGMVKRFMKEAESAAQLSHPNIISIYDIGVAGPLNYFIMAFISGGSLKDQLRTGTVSIERATEIIIQICGALNYAHTMGVIHRDIKPDNIMFDEHGNAILMDFGIAKAKFASKLTATGTLIGTPHYMSPEQLKGKELDGRSDTYSLGILFYEILTGKVPFEGDDTYAIGLKHIQEPPVPPLELNPRIPESLNNIILTMLAKTPEARFSSAQDVASAIEDLLAGKEFDVTKARTAVETWSGQLNHLGETRIEDDLSKTVVRKENSSGSHSSATAVSEAGKNSAPGSKNNALIWAVVIVVVLGAVAAGVFFLLPMLNGSNSASSSNDRSSKEDRKDQKALQENVAENLFSEHELLFTVMKDKKMLVKRILDDRGNLEEHFANQLAIGLETVDITYSPPTDVFIVEQSDGSLISINSAGWDASLVYFDETGGNEGPKMASFADSGLRITFTRIKDARFHLMVSEISEIGIVGETYFLLERAEPLLFPRFIPGSDSMIVYAQFSQEFYKTTFYMVSPEDTEPDKGFEIEGELLNYDLSEAGESFACLMLDGSKRRIEIVNEDNGNGEVLYEDDDMGNGIIFSPDGKYVIVASKDGENKTWDLYAVPLGDGDAVKITDVESKEEIVPMVWKKKTKEIQ